MAQVFIEKHRVVDALTKLINRIEYKRLREKRNIIASKLRSAKKRKSIPIIGWLTKYPISAKEVWGNIYWTERMSYDFMYMEQLCDAKDLLYIANKTNDSKILINEDNINTLHTWLD